MSGPPTPVRLAMGQDQRLLIEWSDGETRLYGVGELRNKCPCATCREKRIQPPAAPSLLTVLSPAEARPLVLQGMKPVGHYAYSIQFSDGHDTGIYTLELLRQLGEPVSGKEASSAPPPEAQAS